jgi:hypothetical protein
MTDVRTLTKDAGHLACDAAYVAVGFVVMALQQAETRRRELAGRVGDVDVDGAMAGLRREVGRRAAAVDLVRARELLAQRAQQLDEALEQVVGFVEASLAPWEEQLPPAAQKAAAQAREQARLAREALRQRIPAAPAPAAPAPAGPAPTDAANAAPADAAPADGAPEAPTPPAQPAADSQ